MANGQIQLPPDGTGKKTQTFTYTSGSDTIHQQTVVIVDENNPTQTQKIDQYGAQYIRFNEGPQQLDGLGNSKFSQAMTNQSYDFAYDKQTRLIGETLTGGGASETSSVYPGILMSVDAVSGSKAIRRSHRWHKIPFSCGGLIEQTIFHGDNGKADHSRRWGYYDDENGFIFELTGTAFNVGVRNNSVDTWYSQSQWNIDALDGSGPSLYTASPSGTRRYWINFKPAGGEVKFGVYNDEGSRVVFHEVYDYYNHKTLPITWELFNTSATSGTSEMTTGNAYVAQEGIDHNHGKISTSFPNAFFNIPTGEDTLLLSIKSRETFKGKTNRMAAIPKALSAWSTHPMSVRIIKNGTLTGATWGYATLPSASIVGDVTATSVAGGQTLVSYFIAPSSSFHHHPENVFAIGKEYIHTFEDPTESVVYTFVANPLSTITPSASLQVGMTWEEII